MGVTREERIDCYRDSSWRAKAWEELSGRSGTLPVNWPALSVAESPNRPDLVGRGVVDLAEERDCTPLDVMLDVSLEDDLRTRFWSVLANDDPDGIAWLLPRDNVLLGLADSGAHVSQLCDACFATDLLGGWVRDREVMPLERAIHKLTAEPAAVYGLADRGVVEVGRAADLVVFDPDTVAPGPLRRVRDFPADGERLTADAPVGMTHTLVNGVPIRVDGEMSTEGLSAAAGRGPPLVSADESRDGVSLTNLDQPLFDGADATKRDLVDYLDAVRDRIIPVLEDRPLSVIRVHRGQDAFMQKNVPKYTPSWVRTVRFWAETSKRDVSYALCNDRRTLLWFANQRAVEYHPTLVRVDRPDRMTHLVLDLDPPDADAFSMAVRVARLVRQALADVGLEGAVKTSGAKGVHVFVPIDDQVPLEDAAAATRAIAARAERLDPEIATTAFMKEDRGGKVFVDSTRVGGATVIAAYSPRVRPGVPVSFPVGWDDLDDIAPADFTVHTALRHLGDGDPWAAQMPEPQSLTAELIDEGHAIPVARVQAMHEGKRRARSREKHS